ncbi:hypothetical protein BpHYR1_012550 [Brachionus plicatilis]|uniref:Uncharacterized protein n=1 Tax=Brachionus plicatilis TaxID=10195 RepID=A0A3M7PJZ4_BRAPC|nr:hypothetical protein BpHYR1_012550 [Brachionus plicatilis]
MNLIEIDYLNDNQIKTKRKRTTLMKNLSIELKSFLKRLSIRSILRIGTKDFEFNFFSLTLKAAIFLPKRLSKPTEPLWVRWLEKSLSILHTFAKSSNSTCKQLKFNI